MTGFAFSFAKDKVSDFVFSSNSFHSLNEYWFRLILIQLATEETV